LILNAQDPSFWDFINKIGHETGWQSPIHTESNLKYYYQLCVDRGDKIIDHSFILCSENEPLIAFLGATVKEKSRINLLAYEVPCIVLENKAKITKKAVKLFLKKFDQITRDINGSICFRDFLINGELTSLSRYLLNKGAQADPLFSQIYDLKRDKLPIKSNIRKSYKSLINWGIRELQPTVFDSTNITWELMDVFRQLHIRESDKETRSVDSWQRQFEMVKKGEAFAVFGFYDDKIVSAGLFAHSKTNCFYGVSASRRELFEKPMFHALLWTAILHAKKLDCRWFEFGGQLFPNHPNDKPPTKKELGISRFKAGFGGGTKIFLDIKLNKHIT